MSSNSISEANNLIADIVVIGGGGAGLAAASTAAERGASVILLEKRSATGGTSVWANGLFAAESPVQKRLGVAALKDDIFKVIMDDTHWTNNPLIWQAFIEKSGETIGWLEDRGIQFSQVGSAFPGIDRPTFHSLGPLKKVGAVIMKTLRQYCEQLGVKILPKCPAKKILINEKGQVAGVLAEVNGKDQRIEAKGVIIASGGYTGNKELLKRYYPAYSDNIAFLGLPNMGDGLLMAMEIGAATEGLGVLLLHPHIYLGSVRIDALAQEPATVWVNKQGNRFADETITFRAIECANAVNRQPDKCNFVLLDRKLKQKIEEDGFIRDGIHGKHVPVNVKLTDLDPDLQAEAARGGVRIADSWEEIALWIGVSSAVLKTTVDDYNNSCDHGYDAVFKKDRRYLQALRTPPFYAIRCYLSCLDSIGGIKINQRMEVVGHQDNPIPGLYAGGDFAGGWESDTYCILLPGSALGFAINSGRLAGENAVKFILG